tara:strand:+ start:275 stop:742 length:468 start_codon:yes stop_codon:yes gene_type:complete
MTINKDIILNILKGPIKQCGYKLLDINFVNHNTEKIVQIFIYRAQGIDFKDCEKVNNLALGLISTEKLCLQDYTLEISSPGIFMKLSKPEHYRIFRGKRIKIELLKEFQGYKFATGNIDNCFEDGIKLKMDNLKDSIHIPFSVISKANLEPEFTI